MKSKTVAGMCALFGGTIGLQFLYLGRMKEWWLSWIFLPFLIVNAFIGIFMGISIFSMSDEDFNLKYNKRGEDATTKK